MVAYTMPRNLPLASRVCSGPMPRKGLLLLFPLLSLTVAHAQTDSLSLDEALRLARQRNGTIRAAQFDVDAAQSRVRQSYAAFFPTLEAQYQYTDQRLESSRFVSRGGGSFITGNFRLLDSGERNFTYQASRKSLESTRFNTREILRETLFSVTQQYFEALRAQQLKRVADSQVDRARLILEQTQLRIKVHDAAPIEELQANADYQNARVQSLAAQNQVTNSAATLKATVGLDEATTMPALADDGGTPPEVIGNLQALVDEGISNRPDLVSRRFAIESLRYSRKRALREAGVTFALDLTDDLQVTPTGLNDRTATFLVSFPFFDGGLRRAQAEELRANISASSADLLQAERTVRAQIESAYAEARTNLERYAAAKIARDAAQRNYSAVVDSRQYGASDLIQVLTAQVSLVTAESNYIQALYDARISDTRLRLVTGRPVPGETTPGVTTP